MSKEKYFMDVVGENALKQVCIVVANINANFLAPIYYPDEIVIQTAIIRLGNKSFTLHQRAVNVRTKQVKCDCQTVMVCCDMDTKESIPMPASFKEKITAFEGHCLT